MQIWTIIKLQCNNILFKQYNRSTGISRNLPDGDQPPHSRLRRQRHAKVNCIVLVLPNETQLIHESSNQKQKKDTNVQSPISVSLPEGWASLPSPNLCLSSIGVHQHRQVNSKGRYTPIPWPVDMGLSYMRPHPVLGKTCECPMSEVQTGPLRYTKAWALMLLLKARKAPKGEKSTLQIVEPPSQKFEFPSQLRRVRKNEQEDDSKMTRSVRDDIRTTLATMTTPAAPINS